MKPEELDEVYAVKELLYIAIHAIVDGQTSELTSDQDDLLRQQLTEEFRFWRRI